MFSQSILITGGAGFIGSNFVADFAARHPDYRLIDLDALTYASFGKAFCEQQRLPNVETVKGDIRDAALVKSVFEDYGVTGVIHFAAESHVDNSIVDPLLFVDTNVNGTVTLLNVARQYWQRKGCLTQARFHHVSTDEVYGTLAPDAGLFTEETPYAPNGPYSASKAASDLLVRAYSRTYAMNTTITNCSNNYGPHQHREKLIPTIIARALAHETIPLYGTGGNIRDWIWVMDHCRAVDLVFHHGRAGESYNVGSRCEKTNLEMTHTVCSLLDALQPWPGHRYAELIGFVKDRPAHDFRYAIDPSKISRELGFAPAMPFEKGMLLTVQWYLQHPEVLKGAPEKN